MAKATPAEKEMHQLAEKDIDAELQKQIENPAPIVVDKAEETAAPGATDAPAPKRGRGRPSNAEKALNDILQKETVGGAGTETPGAAKPGRKPGATKGGMIDAAALGEQLVGIHALAAMFTQIPEFQLQPVEGENLAKAVIAVCQEYNLSLSGKTGAGIQLIAAAAMIYAPRIMHFKNRTAPVKPPIEGQPNAQFAPPAAG